MGCCVAVVGDLWEMVLYMMSRFCCHGYCIVKCFVSFLVADTQVYKRLCPSVSWSVGRSVRHARVEKWENAYFRPCPPVRN